MQAISHTKPSQAQHSTGNWIQCQRPETSHADAFQVVFIFHSPQYHVQNVHQLELTMPDVHPAVGTLHVWVTDGTGAVVARNFVNFEHFVEAPIRRGSNPNSEAIPGFVSINYTPGSASKSSWDEPIREAQLFSADGSGYVAYEILVPEGIDLANCAEMELIFEASSANGGARQTEPEKHPSDVTISVNGVEIETIRIPDCPADARGVLSYIHGQPGTYGYLYRVKVDPSLVLENEADSLTVRYEVKADAAATGGLHSTVPVWVDTRRGPICASILSS